MAQVMRHMALAAGPEAVWAAIGGFQALADWHPAVATCTREDIGVAEHRRLELEGGGEILEKNLGADAHSYGYAIVDSPLPVSHYRAVLSVVPSGPGSVVVWSSTFTANAKDAEAVIAQVYESGLQALKEQFG
ncbi:MAG: SRPBCC family protein [Pseudomonadota bacterium]